MVSGTFELLDLNHVEAALTIKMTIGEWRQLREQLDKAHMHPAWNVTPIIGNLIKKLETHFFESTAALSPAQTEEPR